MGDNVRNDNRRALPKFLLIMLCTGVAGGVLGFLTVLAGDRAGGVAAALERIIAVITPWGIPVTSVVVLGAAWAQYAAARRLFAAWDGEEERVIDAAEEKLSWAQLLSTVQLVLDFFFFAAAPLYLGHRGLLASVGCFLLSAAAVILLQQRVVDLERRINPEKQGSVYDLDFQKKWLGSCDEAEQRRIGQASYRAVQMLNILCPIIWGILVLLNFVAEIGLMPVVIVLLFWGVLNVTYCLECMKLEKRSI